ncbi:L,D-transpeptidase family protein [Necropsobacter rosorum]|uniref:L,D-transpeptidase family protein n=1 Tax=Necropsobacter rosorum TaxID=908285 RepID=UPI000509EE8D
MLKPTSYKFANAAALLMSCAYIGSAVADAKNGVIDPAPIVQAGLTEAKELITLTDEQLAVEQKAIEQQLAIEKQAEEARLYAEQQEQAESRLADVIDTRQLQFKSEIAKIYAQNDYVLLWEDEAARKLFLHEYAAFVASGISRRAAQNLEHIDAAAQTGGLIYDIVLTDTFLDYLYYSKNAMNSAQKWLYSANGYKSALPDENTVQDWLGAVKHNENAAFVARLSSSNSLYKQTVNKLAMLVGSEGNNIADVYKLAINAQRLRVIPSFDNGIFVNIPSYKLNYYRDGRLILDSRVIVGKKARKTPVMYSKLNNVVVNPPWNPTTRLINEDLVPKIKRDPSYVARNGYTILDARGNAVDPYSINWETIGSKFPYRLRQAPGDSALGNYKFNMPSSDAIYLHDTPNHNLFKQKDRALSSGCIRVEQSDQLATILLNEAGWSADKKRKVLDSRRTTWANIQSDNPVYLYYVTRWVDKGQIYTLPDIYDYDVIPNLSYINWHTVKKYLH